MVVANCNRLGLFTDELPYPPRPSGNGTPTKGRWGWGSKPLDRIVKKLSLNVLYPCGCSPCQTLNCGDGPSARKAGGTYESRNTTRTATRKISLRGRGQTAGIPPSIHRLEKIESGIDTDRNCGCGTILGRPRSPQVSRKPTGFLRTLPRTCFVPGVHAIFWLGQRSSTYASSYG
jgi:hypothetical protein